MNQTGNSNNALNLVSSTNSSAEEYVIKSRLQSSFVYSLYNRDSWKSLVQIFIFMILLFVAAVGIALASKYCSMPLWLSEIFTKEVQKAIAMTAYGSLLIGGGISALITFRERSIRMFLSDKGIESPWTNLPAPGSGFKFGWSEIESIKLVDSYSANVRGHSLEFVSNTGKSLSFQILRLDDDDFNHLIKALESWSNPEAMDENLIENLKKWHEFESAKIESYAVLKDGFHYLSNQFSFTSYETRQKDFQFREAPYRVVDVLSAGGISATYLVENLAGERFCLKEYWFEWNEEKDSLIEKLSSYLHAAKARPIEGMVNVHEIFEEDGRFYISTDMYEGTSLREFVQKRKRKLPVTRIKKIMAQLHDILAEFASSEPEIVHGEINPDSIFISKDGTLKIIEPPMVRAVLSTEIEDTFSGFSYSAPELIKGEITPLADAYSFGRILFFLLKRRDPEVHIDLPLKEQNDPFNEVVLGTGNNDIKERMNAFEAVEIIKKVEDKKKLKLLTGKGGKSIK